MRRGMRLLKTKWIPPAPKSSTFRRPEVSKKLKGLVHSPLALVHAAPGYGKTTAVACFMQDEQLTAGWYRIGEDDAKPAVFFRYLLGALNVRFPSVGEKWMRHLEREEEDRETEVWYDLGSDLLNELALLGKRSVLVLDNWHLAEENPLLSGWMEWFFPFAGKFPSRSHQPDPPRLVPVGGDAGEGEPAGGDRRRPVLFRGGSGGVAVRRIRARPFAGGFQAASRADGRMGAAPSADRGEVRRFPKVGRGV